MQTAEERLAWAVGLPGRDLEGCSLADIAKLREELHDFLGVARPGGPEGWSAGEMPFLGWPRPRRELRTFAGDGFRELQQRLQDALLPFADGNTAEPGDLLGSYRSVKLGPLSLSTIPRAGLPKLAGAVPDLVVLAAVLLAAQIGTDRIRRCPECRTVFLRQGRQLYCTRACTNRANQRAWQETPKGRARRERRKSSTARYTAAMRERKRYAERAPARVSHRVTIKGAPDAR